MLSYEDRSTLPAATILAVALVLGLAAGGWFVGQGLARFKSESRTVTVKGLVEREVKADRPSGRSTCGARATRWPTRTSGSPPTATRSSPS